METRVSSVIVYCRRQVELWTLPNAYNTDNLWPQLWMSTIRINCLDFLATHRNPTWFCKSQNATSKRGRLKLWFVSIEGRNFILSFRHFETNFIWLIKEFSQNISHFPRQKSHFHRKFREITPLFLYPDASVQMSLLFTSKVDMKWNQSVTRE